MQDFRELTVWQKSHTLTLDVYRATEGFPKAEIYGLTAQIRRATVSTPSNIAEGCGLGSRPELVRFLRIASGSASELQYQVLLARDLHLLTLETQTELDLQVVEVKRMLTGLIREVQRATAAPSRCVPSHCIASPREPTIRSANKRRALLATRPLTTDH